MDRPYYVASVSFGKDSLAMLHLLLEGGGLLDEVVFFDTGMEFDAIYTERDRTLPLLDEHGIKYTELKPIRPFLYDMLAKPVNGRHGYGWCGGPNRWMTTYKTRTLEKYYRRIPASQVFRYVGIASDEKDRIPRALSSGQLLPLVEAGMTEADCLELCYNRGHTWEQDGVRLYDVLDRVSCWCCRNKNLKELEAMRINLPKYYDMLLGLEERIGVPMKRKPLPRGDDT